VDEKKEANVTHYARLSHKHLHANPDTRVPRCAFRGLHDQTAFAMLSNPIIKYMLFNDNRACGRNKNVVISNLGDVTEYHPTSRKFGPFELLEFYSTQSQAAVGFEIFIVLATFHGELYMSVQYTTPLVSSARGQELANEIVHIIRDIRNFL